MTVIFGVVSVVHDEIHFLDRRFIQSWALPGPLDARISCHTGIETIGGGVLHDLPQLLRQRFRLLFVLPFPEDRLPEAGEELLLIGQDLVRALFGDVLDGRIGSHRLLAVEAIWEYYNRNKTPVVCCKHEDIHFGCRDQRAS